MPRKASHAAKKETSVEPKSEGGSTRRSGRATTKQEPVKEASRSRRSSTAAQTAASVADSKTPKRSTSSRRDSTSPSDSRQKSRRESVESPATRVKSTRRATSRVNYKESDGEEDNVAPKYDDNFESNEEFDDSESDEKNKTKGRTRGVKSPAKGRGSQNKPKGRGRRGRPKKQSSDEDESEAIELSEESVEIESETIGKKTEEPKETTRSGRGRKPRSSVETKSAAEEKPKSSRRSSRSTATKEETSKKRPSRSLQAKRYTEEEEEEDDDDDDDDIEEIHDSKSEEEVKPLTDSGRKRKRGSAAEANKKLKEDENIEKKEKEGEAGEESAEKSSESKSVPDSECEEKKKEPDNEPMEAEDSVDASSKTAPPAKEVGEKIEKQTEEKKESKKDEEKEESAFKISKEKLNFANKQGSIDSSENLDESMHSFDSDQGSRAEQSISSGLEDSQDSKQTKSTEKTASCPEASASEKTKSHVNYQPESSNSFQELDDSSESKSLNESGSNKENKQDPSVDKKEATLDSKAESNQNDASTLQESKPVEFEKTSVTPPGSAGLTGTSHSKESSEVSLNGSEKIPNTTQVIHSTSVINLHPEDSAPKANGAHELHNNSVPENNQYYPFPGRKYVINTKLGDSVRQSVKDKSFGFVSYNLGITSSDSSIQKEKLLNEFNKLDAHIICIQQVSKSFYCGVLEPSLDALGFKGTFSQPEESEKGVATFYKSSLFRLSGQSETSLKNLVEKELEASSLDTSDQVAVKSYVKKCGHVLFTHFATVIGMHSLTVANVQVPSTDLSIHALQVSCLVREVVKVNGGTSRPFLLGGEFNMNESEAPYQLLRDGYLSNDMIEELQRRKDVILPGKENAALVNLLWKSFQHPSSTLCSCYKSVLDHEVFIPEQKITSRDLLWYSSDSLYTVGVLDASETLSDRHFSLKADVAFSV